MIETGKRSRLEGYITYTPAENGAVCLVQLEAGPAEDDLYKVTLRRELVGADLGKVYLYQQILYLPMDSTTVASTVYKYSFSEPVANEYWRIGIKESGVSTNYGTVKARFTVSG